MDADAPPKSRKFRKLRIAWSVACGIACTLLILLLVQSYWWLGSAEMRVSSMGELALISVEGCTYWGTLPNQGWDWNVCIAPLVEENRPITTVTRSSDTRTESRIERIDTTPPTNGASDVNAELNWRGRFGFGLSHSPNMQFISFPHWFLILLSAAFATVPWLRWRFSLRNLLVATTLVAVVLGLMVWGARK